MGPRLAAAQRAEFPYHEIRVLLLVAAFAEVEQDLTGLTKLVKLDFLLRYPTLAEKLLEQYESWPPAIAPSSDERVAVESRMIRYKYGPWDDKYYPIVGALVGRGLVEVVGRSPLSLRLTERGRSVSRDLEQRDEWRGQAERSRHLRRTLDLTGSELKDLIYRLLPEVTDLPHRTEI